MKTGRLRDFPLGSRVRLGGHLAGRVVTVLRASRAKSGNRMRLVQFEDGMRGTISAGLYCEEVTPSHEGNCE